MEVRHDRVDTLLITTVNLPYEWHCLSILSHSPFICLVSLVLCRHCSDTRGGWGRVVTVLISSLSSWSGHSVLHIWAEPGPMTGVQVQASPSQRHPVQTRPARPSPPCLCCLVPRLHIKVTSDSPSFPLALFSIIQVFRWEEEALIIEWVNQRRP